MYEVLKHVIQSGRFVVNDMTEKINVLWAESRLTDEQRDELLNMMINYLDPSTEAPKLIGRVNTLEAKVKSLEMAVEELRAAIKIDPHEPEDPEKAVIPEWMPYDGISTNYQYGAVVTHNGKYYYNMLRDVQNVWEPGSAGVDERYWKEITKEEAEAIVKGETETTEPEEGQENNESS